jgi:hypothetical protein
VLDRRRFALGLLAVLSLALAMRSLPLYWSPYPATLDGFGYVVAARETIAGGSIPLAGFRAEDFVFTSFTVVTSQVLGVRPLFSLQPLMAPVGAAAVLVGVVLVYRCCDGLYSRRRARLAALLAGVLLAVSGIYLRRTLVPDSDILAHVLIPLLALAWYRLLWTGRLAWGWIAGILFVLFPLIHTLSTLIAALAVIGVTTAALVAGRPRRRIALGSLTVAAFWAYVAGYYAFAGAHPQLTVSYVDRISSYPGLFVAWVIVLVIGIAWFGTTSPRLRQAVLAAPFGVAFVALVANATTTVFPGTIPTPPGLLPLMSLYLVVVVFAVRAWERLPARGTALVVLALLGAPVVIMYFALTAALGPGQFATALRSHTFIYLPLLALAAIGAVTAVPGRADPASDGGSQRERSGRVSGVLGRATPSARGIRIGLAAVLVVSMVGTVPMAYVALDTMTVPGTTTPAEFEATAFAATHTTSWASDDPPGRIGRFLYDRGAAVKPVRAWLSGGPPPDQPTLSRDSWAGPGAHFFPGAPASLPRARYDAALECRHLVYATTTRDALVLTVPTERDIAGC